ncbi:hypothetical protein BO70DRAFT_164903 [Aspergillus heteromorphus CBS 117.55]|uniref:Uncharacterized protein n=1 Tax=Aspergillus heteromorphus CBS 117.55 TaxID=1448321 RepID=A0A317WVG7_9EURO|nr:uncharacterized protein BO70DRAFT_164903 [Aspergillus heteromorphus CBS 117.55]PWY89292.1 hypothetical protein BO70DRAFT_164903 [Aspergillus heteromorphus CBS 117.55]
MSTALPAYSPSHGSMAGWLAVEAHGRIWCHAQDQFQCPRSYRSGCTVRHRVEGEMYQPQENGILGIYHHSAVDRPWTMDGGRVVWFRSPLAPGSQKQKCQPRRLLESQRDVSQGGRSFLIPDISLCRHRHHWGGGFRLTGVGTADIFRSCIHHLSRFEASAGTEDNKQLSGGDLSGRTTTNGTCIWLTCLVVECM